VTKIKSFRRVVDTKMKIAGRKIGSWQIFE
jgi:hypothetical protein